MSATATPRMLGCEIIREKRRDSFRKTVAFDDHSRIEFLFTNLYRQADDNPDGVFRGNTCEATVMLPQVRVKFQHDSWFSDGDYAANEKKRQEFEEAELADEANQVVDESRRHKKPKALTEEEIIDIGIKNMLGGYIRFNAEGKKYWAVGILDQVGHLFGVHTHALRKRYPSQEEFGRMKRMVQRRVGDSLTARWVNFRVKCQHDCLQTQAAEIDKNFQERPVVPKQPPIVVPEEKPHTNGTTNKRAPKKIAAKDEGAYLQAVRAAANSIGMPTIVGLILLALDEGCTTQSVMSEFIRLRGYTTTFKTLGEEISYCMKASNRWSALFRANKKTKPYTYKFSYQGTSELRKLYDAIT